MEQLGWLQIGQHLLQSGEVSMKQLSNRLRHSIFSTTADIYTA